MLQSGETIEEYYMQEVYRIWNDKESGDIDYGRIQPLARDWWNLIYHPNAVMNGIMKYSGNWNPIKSARKMRVKVFCLKIFLEKKIMRNIFNK